MTVVFGDRAHSTRRRVGPDTVYTIFVHRLSPGADVGLGTDIDPLTRFGGQRSRPVSSSVPTASDTSVPQAIGGWTAPKSANVPSPQSAPA